MELNKDKTILINSVKIKGILEWIPFCLFCFLFTLRNNDKMYLFDLKQLILLK